MNAFAPEVTEFANPMQLAFYSNTIETILGHNTAIEAISGPVVHRFYDDTNQKYRAELIQKVAFGLHENVLRRAVCLDEVASNYQDCIKDLYNIEYGPQDSGARRVFAIQCVKDDKVYLFGFGKYVGDELPDDDAGGVAPRVRMNRIPNPKIILDDGAIVWGCECWWGPEERFGQEYGKYTIVQASLEGFRGLTKGTSN